MPPFDHETEFPSLSEEDVRLGTLFADADRLAGDNERQDRFLASLSAADRAAVEESLIVANALRLLAQEATPAMSGRARARVHRMLYGDLDAVSDDSPRDGEQDAEGSLSELGIDNPSRIENQDL